MEVSVDGSMVITFESWIHKVRSDLGSKMWKEEGQNGKNNRDADSDCEKNDTGLSVASQNTAHQFNSRIQRMSRFIRSEVADCAHVVQPTN